MWQAHEPATPFGAAGQTAVRAAARRQWEQNCDYLLDRYLDNAAAVEALKEQLYALYPNNADTMLPNLLSLNLVRKVVDTRAKLYRKSPERRMQTKLGQNLAADDPAIGAQQRLYRACRVNAQMRWAARLMELLNAAVVWGQIDGRRKQPLLTVLPPHQLLVEQNPDAPGELQAALAIYVPVGGAPDSVGAQAAELGYLRYRKVWDARRERPSVEVTRLDGAFQPLGVQPPELAAYAALSDFPFALLRKDEPVEAELFPDVPHSLLLAARWLDHELTRGALNSRQTDFPAYVYNGTPDELGAVNPATGAGTVICLGDDDKKLVPLQVDPREKDRNQNLLFFLKLFAQTMQMTPSAFTFDVELLSGVAKFHDKQPEIEYREDMIDVLAAFESEQLWPLVRSLAQLAGFTGAPALAEHGLAVAFAEQVIPLSREEELKNLEREIRLGLTHPAEVIAKRQGISVTQAEATVARNLDAAAACGLID